MTHQLIKSLSIAKSSTNSTSLVTLYIPNSTKIIEVSKMITSEISKTVNIKSRQTRQGVQDALQAVSSQLKRFASIPNNGLAIFTGQTSDGLISVSVEPVRPIDRFMYHCDSKFCV